jgi:hypothetical protein
MPPAAAPRCSIGSGSNRRRGEVRRGRVGISTQDLTPELAAAVHARRNEGALIAEVVPKSPAEQAGIRKGDLVIAANGAPIRSATQLCNKSSRWNATALHKRSRCASGLQPKAPPIDRAGAGDVSGARWSAGGRRRATSRSTREARATRRPEKRARASFGSWNVCLQESRSDSMPRLEQ